jgi:hypothetical protein
MAKKTLEDKMMDLQAEAAGAAECYRKKIQFLQQKLTKRCTHKYTAPYRWEHDNGYGRQHMIIGERCVSCDKRRPWSGSGAWYALEELRV